LKKQTRLAGTAFEKAAEAQIKAGSKDEAANTLVDAFKSYRQDDPASAARCLEQSIEFFTLRGQFRRAANYQMELGQLYEEDLMDFSKAIESYQTAGDWFEGDSAQALASKAFLKSADMSALQGEYIKATEVYKKIASNALNNSITRWSVKDYFLKIVLCYLAADDQVAATKYLEETASLDHSFTTTREYKFLSGVLEAVQDGDSEKLSNVVFEYDQFNKLDKWKTDVLLKVKNGIISADDDLL
jgi:alpha-soluble NSF attachment protein